MPIDSAGDDRILSGNFSGVAGADIFMYDTQVAKLEYIHWLKGLGIFLVVFGHFYASAFVLPGFKLAHDVVYIFHMPLFMAISGFLFARSSAVPFGALMKKKFLRLMIPYISISAVIMAAKLTAGWLHFGLQRPVEAGDWLAFLFYPRQGFACFLWYMYTLFIIFGVVGLLRVCRIPLWLIGVLAVGAWFLPLPAYFCLDLAGANLFFFVLGMILARAVVNLPAWNRRTAWGVVLGAWLIFGGCAWFVLGAGARIQGLALVAASSGILASWLTAMWVGREGAGVLAGLGRASAAVYLLHTLVMGFVRFVWEFGLGVESRWAAMLFFISSVGLGLAVPVWIQRQVLDRIPLVSRIFLGTGPVFPARQPE